MMQEEEGKGRGMWEREGGGGNFVFGWAHGVFRRVFWFSCILEFLYWLSLHLMRSTNEGKLRFHLDKKLCV